MILDTGDLILFDTTINEGEGLIVFLGWQSLEKSIPFPSYACRQASKPGRTFGIRNEGLFHDCEGDAVLVRHNIIINNRSRSLISKDFVLLWSSVRDFSALLIIVEHAWN